MSYLLPLSSLLLDLLATLEFGTYPNITCQSKLNHLNCTLHSWKKKKAKKKKKHTDTDTDTDTEEYVWQKSRCTVYSHIVYVVYC